MKNKIVALMLSAVMAVSVMAGCGQEKNPVSSTESVTNQSEVSTASTDATVETEPKEIAVDHFAGTTIDIVVVKKAKDTCTDWNEKEIFKMAEEATGIHVNWTVIDPSVSSDKIAVMLMSDDQPDAYLGALNENILSSNFDLFYDLSEEGLLETYAPKVVEDYNSVEGAWESITWMDGSIRGLITGSMVAGVGDYINSPLIINTEWLKKIGKEVPTTADELYEVLVAFRDGDMDGDGDPNNEIPMSFCDNIYQAPFTDLANAFGIGSNPGWEPQNSYKNIKDGKVVSTVDTDNFRAFLEFFHKLHAEGLLDVEGFSQTSDQYVAKMNAKVVGVLASYTTLMDQEYVPFVYQGIEGVEPVLTGLVDAFIGQRSNFCITADSENVEAVLHWWNWLSKDRVTKLTAYYGSGYFEEVDGEIYKKKELPEGYSYPTEGMHNMAPALIAGELPATYPDAMKATAVARNKYIEENMHLINQEGFAVAYGDPENAEERAFMESELFTYIQTFTADAVVNGITDASWEKHLNDLKTVQYYEWLQWYQDFEDEVASR